jgi:FkbM family methyltransferase
VSQVRRPVPFVLVSSNHGTLIVNRNDYHMVDDERGFGVGFQIMTASGYDQPEVAFALTLLQFRRAHFGPGVAAIDCGANIGVHTVEWARFMFGWGHVHAFEAQEKIFYALAGNVVINNCLNVTARHAAVGAECGTLVIPEPDYLRPASYGSLELRGRGEHTEFIGQRIDYAHADRRVPLVNIDSLGLERLDFVKIDVEGMELEVLQGAACSLERHRPNLLVEVTKSDRIAIERRLKALGYQTHLLGANLFGLHAADPLVARLKIENGMLAFT